MQKLVDLIEEKEKNFSGELFYAAGEFFAIHDGKIAKLPDFSGDFRAIYKLTSATERIIVNYLEENGLDAEYLAEALEIFNGELQLHETEIPDGLDYDSFNFLVACDDAGIVPYNAYMALKMISEQLESDTWQLLDRYGEYKNALEYISDGCELINFSYTDEEDDEYWESVVSNIEDYVFKGGEIF